MNIIEQAIDILERDGWCQKEMHLASGEHCMMGAVARAAYRHGDELFAGGQRRYFDAAFDAMHDELRDRSTTMTIVPQWNDKPGRTFDEVVDFMRHAAKRLGGDG